MSIQWEVHQSRNFDLGKQVSLTRRWFVGEASDETLALLTALAATPAIYDGLVRESAKGEPQGGGNWFVDIEYRNIDPQQALLNDAGPGGDGGTTPQAQSPATEDEPLWASYSFNTTGKTEHVTQSIKTWLKISAAGFGATDKTEAQAANVNFILDNQLGIAPSETGVAGCDKHVPSFEWSREIVRGYVTQKYLRTLRSLTGRINNAPFYHWDTNEVLYLGATGKLDKGRWTITHNFAVEETQIDFPIGNGIVVPKRRGWDLLWVRYRPKVVNNLSLQVPQSAYVEKIYKDGDFSLLEIGV